jgi:predicted DsbA family dithiol-disulfide isomerase
MSKTLQLDVISDIACPWCAVGVNALDLAIAKLAPEITVGLRFQPFELNPAMTPEGADTLQYLQDKYGISAEQVRGNQANIRAKGAAVGFNFGARTRVWNTFDAHRLLHWAGLQGKQHALKHALLQAYHGDDRNPSDHAVLVELAGAVGLDAQEAQRILASDTYGAEVRAQEVKWQQAGIHGVPAVVVNGKHLIEGAQPAEVFEQALRQIAAEL